MRDGWQQRCVARGHRLGLDLQVEVERNDQPSGTVLRGQVGADAGDLRIDRDLWKVAGSSRTMLVGDEQRRGVGLPGTGRQAGDGDHGDQHDHGAQCDRGPRWEVEARRADDRTTRTGSSSAEPDEPEGTGRTAAESRR